jgi:enamine deaminase RidA (YjgF/YER057c/UK114 family)
MGRRRRHVPVNAISEQYFRSPYPARSTVGCNLPRVLIEVEAVALEREGGMD